MASLPDTFFMPQQPLLKVEGVAPRREPVNVALVVSIIVFFVVLVVAAGEYFYKIKVDAQVAAAQMALVDAEKTFSIEDINAFKMLQTKLDTAKQLVDNHTIFSTVFGLIEANAAENIGLTSLGFTDGTGGKLKLTLNGDAPSYVAAYFQIQTWRKLTVLSDITVTAFTLNEQTGIVNFGMTAEIDPQYVAYARVLEAGQAAQPIVSPNLPAVSATPPASATATNTLKKP